MYLTVVRRGVCIFVCVRVSECENMFILCMCLCVSAERNIHVCACVCT